MKINPRKVRQIIKDIWDTLLFPETGLQRKLGAVFMSLIVIGLTVLMLLGWALIAESLTTRWQDGRAFMGLWISGIVITGAVITGILRK